MKRKNSDVIRDFMLSSIRQMKAAGMSDDRIEVALQNGGLENFAMATIKSPKNDTSIASNGLAVCLTKLMLFSETEVSEMVAGWRKVGIKRPQLIEGVIENAQRPLV